ncbi:MAG TPA: SRPBCC domain-containing protein [Gammaproteobacteria bacterium]
MLAYTWSESSDEPSQVTFELSRQASKVRLVLTHGRLATRDDMLGVSAGWHAHVRHSHCPVFIYAI